MKKQVSRGQKSKEVPKRVEEILNVPLVILDAAEAEGEYGTFLMVKAYALGTGYITFACGGRLMEELQNEADNLPVAFKVVSTSTKGGRRMNMLEELTDEEYERLISEYDSN